MNISKITGEINKFGKANILVVGDIMLDKYIWGDVNRISQEAPVQIVNVVNETYLPGGAANVANNLVSLGAKVTLVGLVGDDEEKDRLIKELNKKNIGTDGIFVDSKRPTTKKVRIVSKNQQLLRIDYEKSQNADHDISRKLISFVESKIGCHDILIISDYSKGVITKEVLISIKEICKNNGKKIIADSKPNNLHLYRGVFMITPNHHEACKFALVDDKNEDDHIFMAGEKLKDNLNTNVLITRGSRGMTLFEKGKDPLNMPAKTREVYDITGAGDTVVAALAIAIASGSDLGTASLISNYAAGVVVGKLGTSTLTKEELIEAINNG